MLYLKVYGFILLMLVAIAISLPDDQLHSALMGLVPPGIVLVLLWLAWAALRWHNRGTDDDY